MTMKPPRMSCRPNGPSVTTFFIPFTTLPFPASGCPGSFRCPAIPRLVIHAAHLGTCSAAAAGGEIARGFRKRRTNALTDELQRMIVDQAPWTHAHCVTCDAPRSRADHGGQPQLDLNGNDHRARRHP